MHSLSTSKLAAIWTALLAFTLLEVALALPRLAPLLFLLVLLGLSIVKSALIIRYFMHMKFAPRALFLALFPILVVFILLLMGFLPDAMRLPELHS